MVVFLLGADALCLYIQLFIFPYRLVFLSLWMSLGTHVPVLALKVFFDFLFSSYFWDLMGVLIWRLCLISCSYWTWHCSRCINMASMALAPVTTGNACCCWIYVECPTILYTPILEQFSVAGHGDKGARAETWVSINKRSCIKIMRIGTRTCCGSICR